MESDPNYREVLEFWFGAEPGAQRAEWFRKDEAFDGEIRRRFGALHARAARRELEAWRASPEPLLALVVVLDQFSRNLHRGEAQAFAGDELARQLAREALACGEDSGLPPEQRLFLYLPFEHSEDLADQDLSMHLHEQLGVEDWTRYARAHRELISRFGRFPHRNATLGRESTAEEVAALAQPGSRF